MLKYKNMCNYTEHLLQLGLENSMERVNKINEGNGYALMSCIVMGTKKKSCVLQQRYKLLRNSEWKL